MNLSYQFGPDPERAYALDQRMHLGLAESLEHIVEWARGVAELDAEPLEIPIAHVRAGRLLPPAAFGWYYELGIALFDGDFAAAVEATGRLAQIRPRDGMVPVVTLDHPHVTAHGDLYIRRMGRDATEDGMVAPAHETAVAFEERLAAGFALLDNAAPELAAEVRALVHEILLATGKEDATAEFDGASFYQLWGLLLLNPRFHRTPVAVAEVLAHESAHSLLFGFTYEEPLVLNPDDELFPSPLRRDPRPMDGIYHATFVSARMCWIMHRLAESRMLDSALRDTAATAAARDVRNFAMGLSVVEEHGRLSDTGNALMTAARDYMATVDV